MPPATFDGLPVNQAHDWTNRVEYATVNSKMLRACS